MTGLDIVELLGVKNVLPITADTMPGRSGQDNVNTNW
jgi:hypothetical protein